MHVNLPPDVEQTTDSQSSANQSIIIDTGKHVAVVAICAALCGLSVAVSVWSAYTARDAATEARVTQYYLMDPHSRTPDELAAWAKFRLKHEKE